MQEILTLFIVSLCIYIPSSIFAFSVDYELFYVGACGILIALEVIAYGKWLRLDESQRISIDLIGDMNMAKLHMWSSFYFDISFADRLLMLLERDNEVEEHGQESKNINIV